VRGGLPGSRCGWLGRRVSWPLGRGAGLGPRAHNVVLCTVRADVSYDADSYCAPPHSTALYGVLRFLRRQDDDGPRPQPRRSRRSAHRLPPCGPPRLPVRPVVITSPLSRPHDRRRDGAGVRAPHGACCSLRARARRVGLSGPAAGVGAQRPRFRRAQTPTRPPLGSCGRWSTGARVPPAAFGSARRPVSCAGLGVCIHRKAEGGGLCSAPLVYGSSSSRRS